MLRMTHLTATEALVEAVIARSARRECNVAFARRAAVGSERRF